MAEIRFKNHYTGFRDPLTDRTTLFWTTLLTPGVVDRRRSSYVVIYDPTSRVWKNYTQKKKKWHKITISSECRI